MDETVLLEAGLDRVNDSRELKEPAELTLTEVEEYKDTVET